MITDNSEPADYRAFGLSVIYVHRVREKYLMYISRK